MEGWQKCHCYTFIPDYLQKIGVFCYKLDKEFPWLINCEGSMDATVITSIFDIKQMILDTMDDADDDVNL